MAKRRRTRPPARPTRRRPAASKPAFARRATVGKSASVRALSARHVPRDRAPQPTSGLAPGMQTVNAYLAVADVSATVDFMQRAFGFARGVVLADPDGQLRYAEMRHGDSVVMLIRQGDEATPTGGAAALYTYVQDVDGALLRAREAGAGASEAEDRPWGDRAAVVTDPNGYRWILATFKKLAPFS